MVSSFVIRHLLRLLIDQASDPASDEVRPEGNFSPDLRLAQPGGPSAVFLPHDKSTTELSKRLFIPARNEDGGCNDTSYSLAPSSG